MLAAYSQFFPVIIAFILFPVVIKVVMRLAPSLGKSTILTVGSFFGVYLLTFLSIIMDGPFRGQFYLSAELSFFFVFMYVIVITIHWLLIRKYAVQGGVKTLGVFLFPIMILILVKYLPLQHYFFAATTSVRTGGVDIFIGISYMAFRLSYLTLQVRNNAIELPDFNSYFGFAFFLPTISVGPINDFKRHTSNPGSTGIPGASGRILAGAVKYFFLAAMFNQLTYAGLLLDGRPHHLIDLFVAMCSYYIYLYLNFSGFCDMAIGAAGAIGIPVAENFDSPFISRDVKEFWNRWHITLSTYVRDVIFSPLSKALVSRFGPARANHAIALSIMVVFIVVGVWHGVGWNYLIFGLLHALAVVVNHYYTIILKKWLGREGFLAYSRSKFIKWAAICVTFLYISMTLFVFANDFTSINQIFKALW